MKSGVFRGGSKIAEVSSSGAGEIKITSLDPEEMTRIEYEVDEILQTVPSRVWDGRSLPVPIHQIAREVYGLKVRHVGHDQMKEVIGPAAGDGTISGLLLTEIGEIWINEWEAQHPEWGPARKRFTIGHELGHFVMHQTGRPTIYCRASEAGESLETEPTPRTVPEVEANTFSAALLMPASLVRPQMKDGKVDAAHFAHLMKIFGASDKAMRRRVEALQTIS